MPPPAAQPAHPAADRPVARLRSPGELAAAVPWLCGFVPTESLVLLSLRGPGSRLGLTVRVDLPPEPGPAALVDELAARLAYDGATAAAVLVHTDEPGFLPRADLVRAVAAALRAAGVEPLDRLLVRDGRWWSYACPAPDCCPPEGTAVPTTSPALGMVAAAGTLSGRSVLPSRQALEQGLLPSREPATAARLAAAQAARRRRCAVEGRVAVARDALHLWRGALRDAPVREPADDVAAALVVALEDAVVRDTVLTWVLDVDGPLLWLLLALARRSGPPHDVDVCALLAWAAHAGGDGALASVALERALSADPRHGLARLCREALDHQVSPRAVRDLLAEARQVLRRQHPETALPAQ